MYYRFLKPKNLEHYIVNKSYIAIDGVSLTICNEQDNWFEIMFIPHTLSNTIANNYQINSIVNIEIDILARYIEKFYQSSCYKNTESIDLYFARSTVEQVVSDLKNGKMIIVTDDPEREDEGDIVIAAEKVTEEAISFMVRKASGLVCLSITQYLADQLQLNLMVNEQDNEEFNKAAY
ncbi:MAG: 3,4-dihydroxy-2-butanone-4-phosphate synthase [Candidatus Rickettsia vulgarisii]